jgi:hypothetical protein
LTRQTFDAAKVFAAGASFLGVFLIQRTIVFA